MEDRPRFNEPCSLGVARTEGFPGALALGTPRYSGKLKLRHCSPAANLIVHVAGHSSAAATTTG